MGIKSKVFGFIAAAALSLSMVGAASAAESNTSVTVSVQESQCSVSASEGSVNLGTWKYSGAGYTIAGGSASSSITWNIVSGHPDGCTAKLTFGGLTSATTTSTIGLDNFSGSILGSGFQHNGPLEGSFVDASTNVSFNVPTSTFQGQINLDSVPSDTDPGWYTGNIEATVINAQ